MTFYFKFSSGLSYSWLVLLMIPVAEPVVHPEPVPTDSAYKTRRGRAVKPPSYLNDFDCLKPIFHQNAKYLASGVGVGQCTRRQNFALPNAKYTNMLVSFALGDANSLRWPCTFLFFCVDFFDFLATQREPHFQWNIGGGGSPMQHFRVGHVHFMLFIPFFSALGTQRECFSQ